jgi:hypothetical protein
VKAVTPVLRTGLAYVNRGKIMRSILFPEDSIGGVPQRRAWSGVLTGSGSSISGVPSGSGNLSVQVRDAAGASYTATLSVTVCDPNVIICE